MQPKKHKETPDLFRARLDQILDRSHPLFVLSNQIDWSVFDTKFGPTYVEDKGRPGKPAPLPRSKTLMLFSTGNAFRGESESRK